MYNKSSKVHEGKETEGLLIPGQVEAGPARAVIGISMQSGSHPNFYVDVKFGAVQGLFQSPDILVADRLVSSAFFRREIAS